MWSDFWSFKAKFFVSGKSDDGLEGKRDCNKDTTQVEYPIQVLYLMHVFSFFFICLCFLFTTPPPATAAGGAMLLFRYGLRIVLSHEILFCLDTRRLLLYPTDCVLWCGLKKRKKTDLIGCWTKKIERKRFICAGRSSSSSGLIPSVRWCCWCYTWGFYSLVFRG